MMTKVTFVKLSLFIMFSEKSHNFLLSFYPVSVASLFPALTDVPGFCLSIPLPPLPNCSRSLFLTVESPHSPTPSPHLTTPCSSKFGPL